MVRARTRTAPVRALLYRLAAPSAAAQACQSGWMFSLQPAMNVVPVFAPAQLRTSCVPKLPAHEARPQATTSAAGRLHGNRVISGGFYARKSRESAQNTRVPMQPRALRGARSYLQHRDKRQQILMVTDTPGARRATRRRSWNRCAVLANSDARRHKA